MPVQSTDANLTHVSCKSMASSKNGHTHIYILPVIELLTRFIIGASVEDETAQSIATAVIWTVVCILGALLQYFQTLELSSTINLSERLLKICTMHQNLVTFLTSR